MIDLLKNYNDLRNAPGYASTIRYYLAKKKLDVHLLQSRHSSSSGSALTRRSLSSCLRKPKRISLRRLSSPILSSYTTRSQSTAACISTHLRSTSTPRLYSATPSLPPEDHNRKEVPFSLADHAQRRSMNETHAGHSLIRSTILSKPLHV
jgi:hypothetical protein